MGEILTTFCSQGELKRGMGKSVKYHGGDEERERILEDKWGGVPDFVSYGWSGCDFPAKAGNRTHEPLFPFKKRPIPNERLEAVNGERITCLSVPTQLSSLWFSGFELF